VVWGGDVFFLHYTTWLDAYVPPVVCIPIGAVLLLLSLWLAWASHKTIFGEVREEPRVIREGVYGLARHPMYLSEILLCLGLLVFGISIAAAVVWIVACAFLHRISRYEEEQLIARFGDAYRQYMDEVPMWIPRIARGRTRS